MKRIGLHLVVLPLVLLVGCDGDSTSSTTTQTSVTIGSGAFNVGAGSSEKLSEFNIDEPGQLELTVTWSTGPANLTSGMEAMGGAIVANIGGSPLVTRMDVTQVLLDSSNVFAAMAANNDTVDAEIQFTIIFTPEG
jgi:hypothetical protein